MTTENVYVLTGSWRDENFIEAYIAPSPEAAAQLARMQSKEFDADAEAVTVLSVVDAGIKVSG